MPRHIVGLVSGLGWHVQDLQRAAARLNFHFAPVAFPSIEARVAPAGACVRAGAHTLDTADAVLVRMMPPGSLEQVVFRMDALHVLEARGVVVVNPPRAVEAAVDKYLALARLQQAGLPTPRTWVGETSAGALRACADLGGDVVIKPLFGSEGRGLVRAADRETAGRVVRALERIHSILYIQEYVQHEGFDVRVLVVAGRVVAAMRRHSAAGQWRTNLAQGGKAESLELDNPTRQLAIEAAGALHARWAGVDLLPARDGRMLVLEVNAVPGWRGLAAATGVDIATALLADLSQLLAGRRP